MTEDDKKKVREFIEQNKCKKDTTVWAEAAKKMAPFIIGEEQLKKGLLLAYINSGKDLVLKRRRLNSLLIGDPGLAKSKMLRYMARLGGGNSTFASAADSSAKSLIAVIDSEEKVLRIGPIPRAHGGICSIDEVGRMSPEEQGYLLSAMEEGEIPFARMAFLSNYQLQTHSFSQQIPKVNQGS